MPPLNQPMPNVERKAFAFEIKDAEKGEVVAVVATLGVVDKDGDVILRGAVPPGSKVKLSAYRHDIILDGEPPAGIGTVSEEGNKLVLRGRFFMSTTRGRESFLTVKELGPDSEWSIGFPTDDVETAELTTDWRGLGARRVIKKMRLIEASPVLQGAGVGTYTVAVKEEKPAPDPEPVPDPPPTPTPEEIEAKERADAEAKAAADQLAAQRKARAQAAIDDAQGTLRRLRRLGYVA